MAGCGTWAEELVVPWQAVIPIDHDVPFDYAALLGCGIPTGVGAAINTAQVAPGSSVAVVGCGGVGLAAIQGARIAGAATILAVDPLPAKHGLALALGATHAVTPDDAEQARKELAGGAGFDYAFEVVGVAATIRSAWRLARRGGTVIVVGAGTRADTVPFSVFELLYDGKELLSSLYGHCDLRRDIPRFVSLWRAGLLNIEGLITSRIAFGQLNDAITALRRGDAIRQVVTFGYAGCRSGPADGGSQLRVPAAIATPTEIRMSPPSCSLRGPDHFPILAPSSRPIIDKATLTRPITTAPVRMATW